MCISNRELKAPREGVDKKNLLVCISNRELKAMPYMPCALSTSTSASQIEN